VEIYQIQAAFGSIFVRGEQQATADEAKTI
jgi:hypothetical protein